MIVGAALLLLFSNFGVIFASINHKLCNNLVHQYCGGLKAIYSASALLNITKQILFSDNCFDPSNEKEFGPSLSIAILSRVTESIYSYAAFSLFVQALYSLQNMYKTMPTLHDEERLRSTATDDYLVHRKISLLQRAMNNENAYHDYYVWMDSGHNCKSFCAHFG